MSYQDSPCSPFELRRAMTEPGEALSELLATVAEAEANWRFDDELDLRTRQNGYR